MLVSSPGTRGVAARCYPYRYHHAAFMTALAPRRCRIAVKLKEQNVILAVSSSSTRLMSSRQYAATSLRQSKEDGVNENNDMSYPHCIFGYGSLMCSDSRRATNPTLANKRATPVILDHWERVWSARTLSGYTAMGIALTEAPPQPPLLNSSLPTSYCTGMIIRDISDAELVDLDRRESAYDRVSIGLRDIRKIPFLDPKLFYGDQDILWEERERSSQISNNTNVKVWVYVPKNPLLPDESHPILQSYVDVILRGCFSVGADFAQSFVATTKGWRVEDGTESNENQPPMPLLNYPNGTALTSNNNNNKPSSLSYRRWVNDRTCPLYPRADTNYSHTNAVRIDSLLTQSDHVRLAEDRVAYDPVRHMAVLKEAHQRGLVSSMALNRVSERLAQSEAGLT